MIPPEELVARMHLNCAECGHRHEITAVVESRAREMLWRGLHQSPSCPAESAPNADSPRPEETVPEADAQKPIRPAVPEPVSGGVDWESDSCPRCQQRGPVRHCENCGENW